MSLKFAEFLISMITYFIAYLIVTTLAGFFQAWVAKKMGDDSAEEAGFLSLNPMDHLDFLGLSCLYLFRFGWGKPIPINPHVIWGNWRWLKLIWIYISYAWAHVIMATFAMTALLVQFNLSVIGLSADMMLSGNLSHERFALAYPESSSLAISMALILIEIIFLSVLLAVFNFFFRGFELLLMFLREKYPQFVAEHQSGLLFFVYAIIVAIFIIPQMRLSMVLLIAQWGYILAQFFGGC